MDFKDKNGNPAPVRQALHAKAVLTARLLSGEKFTPEARTKLAQESFEKGKQAANRTNRRVSAGRALAGGKSTGRIGAEERFTSLRDAYNDRNGAF
jgi:hypothetical protein